MQPGTFMMRFGVIVLLGPVALLISLLSWSIAPFAFCFIGGLILSIPFTLQINAEKAKFISIAENTQLSFNPEYPFMGEWNPSSPILWGKVGNNDCIVWFRKEPYLHRSWADYKLESRKNSNLVFDIMLSRPIGLDLNIYPQNLLSTLSEKAKHGLFTKVQDIEIGVPAFDSAFRIQARDQDLVKHFLNPDRLNSIFGYYHFIDTNVKLAFSTTISDDRISTICNLHTSRIDPNVATSVIIAMSQLAEQINQ